MIFTYRCALHAFYEYFTEKIGFSNLVPMHTDEKDGIAFFVASFKKEQILLISFPFFLFIDLVMIAEATSALRSNKVRNIV
jgi:hypothetical protein